VETTPSSSSALKRIGMNRPKKGLGFKTWRGTYGRRNSQDVSKTSTVRKMPLFSHLRSDYVGGSFEMTMVRWLPVVDERNEFIP